jgi:hypothetical protein
VELRPVDEPGDDLAHIVLLAWRGRQNAVEFVRIVQWVLGWGEATHRAACIVEILDDATA